MAVLVAQGLGKRYGPVQAVDHVDLQVEAGTIVGLVGNNGAGKTTSLKMLSGILRPTRGTVRLDGQDPARAPVRSRLGFLPEDSPLYDDQTPEAYLRFFGGLYGLSRDVLDDRIPHLLDDLRLDRPYWRRPIGRLSKGSARKVAIARCLLHDPEVLLLDEPSSGLDPATRHELESYLLRLREQGKAILLSAHDLEQVERLCDEILLVHGGRIVERGTLAQLRQRWGGWTYHVHASVPFTGSHPEGPLHVAALADMEAAQAAMLEAQENGGSVVQLESRPPRLDEILRQAAAA